MRKVLIKKKSTTYRLNDSGVMFKRILFKRINLNLNFKNHFIQEMSARKDSENWQSEI